MNDFDRVKEVSDIVDYARGLTMLRKSGKSFKGLCPIHDEKTPSFTIDPSQQVFYCHGCEAGGDIIKLIELTENVGAYEALERLAERKGIALTLSDDEGYKHRKEVQRKQEALVNKAHENAGKKEAADYIISRGFTQETVTRFKIGYGSQNHSLIIPLTDHRGMDIGYAQRFIGDPPPGLSKYLLPSNNPESPIYNELFNKSDFLFNEFNARKAAKKDSYILVFEGQLDAITADQIGFSASVAGMQASLTIEQAKRLDNIANNENVIVLVPDRNRVGIKSIEKNYELIKSINKNRIVKVMLLPDEKHEGKEMDFNDFVAKRNMTRAEAESYITYGEVGLIEVMLHEAKDISVQHEYAQDIASKTDNPFIREAIGNRLSEAWGVTAEKVDKMLAITRKEDKYDKLKTIDHFQEDYLARLFSSGTSSLKTGYEEMDQVLNSGMGIPTGWVLTYLARSGVGKTAFVLNIINHVARYQEIGSMFFSFEQQGSDIYPKLVAIHEEMNQKKVYFEYANFGSEEYHKRLQATYNKKLLTWEYSRLNIEEIEELINIADERYFDESPCKLIVIDYLGYIKTGDRSKYEEVSKLTAEIKQVAKRTNKLILLLAQTGRGGERGSSDGSKPVGFADARDSGTIEENSDIILGAYRPELDNKLDSKDVIQVIDDYHIQVLKNRGGAIGKDFTYRFDKQKQIIRSWRDSEKETIQRQIIEKCMNMGSEEERINYVRSAM